MKILVFSTQHMPTGGIESHLKEFCLRMTESGVEIDLVITNSAMLPETEAYYRRLCRRVYLGKTGRSSARFLWLLTVMSALRFRKYEALYTNGQGNSILLLAKLMAGGKRWVHHHHTAGDADDQSAWGTSYWKALQKANNVIACSQTNAAIMSQALARPVDTIPCFSSGVTPLSLTNPKTSQVRFGYYGRLIPEKGIDLMCQLSDDAELSGIEFHIWGEGEAYPPAFFKQYPNVIYHGSFSGREELTRVLTSLDALLLLTTNAEGLPISLLEAMSAGLPWLATNRGGIPDIALDTNATRVIPVSSNYAEIKRAIITMAIDIKAGSISGNHQIDLYARMFSAKVLVRQWRKMLGLNKFNNYHSTPLNA